MRWGESETLKFVNLYLKHEYLWNPDSPGYKCRNKRQEAYKDIISGFNSATGILMDEVDLKVKVKNLRSTYAQELAKIKRRSVDNFVYTPSIKWFSEWHTCFADIKQRSGGSIDQTDPIEDANPNQWAQPNDQGDNKILFLVSEPDSYSTLKIEAEEAEEDKEDELSERDEDCHKLKRKKLKHMKSSPKYQRPDSTVMEDEFDIYGKYIATQLRSMDLQRALKVQLDIHSIVSEARMSSLAEN